MKRLVQNCLLVIVGITAGFLLTEAVIRTTFPSYSRITKIYQRIESERGKFSRYDRELGWAGLENAAGDFEWADTRHQVLQNRFGYRGPEHSFNRTDKKRILVLGDSFVWGFGVEEKDLFTSKIEKEFPEPVEIINTGVSGYGTDQEYLLWRQKGHLWSPDKVVLMITVFTDFWDNLSPARYNYPKPYFQMSEQGDLELLNVPVPQKAGPWKEPTRKLPIKQKWAGRLLSHSALANVLVTAVVNNSASRSYFESFGIVPRRLPGYDWEYLLYMTNMDASTIAKWSIMFQLIHKLDSDVTASGGDLSVVIIPSIVQVYPELWQEFIQYSSLPAHMILDPQAPNRQIINWCRKNNIHVIDLLPGLKKEARSNPYLYYPLNRHWTRAGHSVVARILSSALQ